MNRRSFLARAAVAPIAAPAAAKEIASSAINTASISGQVGLAGMGSHFPETTPLMRKFWKAQDLLRMKGEAKETASYRPAPYHISEKKSWSPAFKHHAFVAHEIERCERRAKNDIGYGEELTDAVMRKVIRMAGMDE